MVKVHQIRVPEYASPGNKISVDVVVSHNLDDGPKEGKFKSVALTAKASHNDNPVIATCISIPVGEKYVITGESNVGTIGHYHEYTRDRMGVGDGTIFMPSENIFVDVVAGGLQPKWQLNNSRYSEICNYSLSSEYWRHGNDDSVAAKKEIKYMPFGFRPSNTKIDDVSVVGGGVSSLESEVTYKVTSPVDVVADSELSIIDIEAGSILKTASLSSKLNGTNQQNATVKRTAKLNIEAGERIPESINLCGRVNNAERAT